MSVTPLPAAASLKPTTPQAMKAAGALQADIETL